MINICLYGRPTTNMGQLTGLLLNHPDVKLHSVVAVGKEGRRLDATFAGLVGATDLIVSEQPDYEQIDLIFTDQPLANVPENVKTVGYHTDCLHDSTLTYGLPEMGRRRIVTDCTRAVVPSPEAMATLLALLPLGKNLMLNQSIDVQITTPAQVDTTQILNELHSALRTVQNSFNAQINITLNHTDNPRQAAAIVSIPVSTSAELLAELYNNAYANHHFTYLINHIPQHFEVENTNSCLLAIEQTDSRHISIHAALDRQLKGSAGTAIHLMNLMFGFYECVGLELKGTGQPIP